MTQETERGHSCAFLHDMYVELRMCNCSLRFMVRTAHHCSDELHTSPKLTENSY